MKTKNIIIAIFSGFILSSCSDDFLDLAPISNMNVKQFYKTEADFQQAVNAAYQTLYTQYAPESGVCYCGETMSDEATMYMVIGNVADKWAFKDYNLKANNTIVNTIWNDGFVAMNKVNIVIEKLQSSNLESNTKNSFEAEMRFLRGLYYFNMVRMFGPVPLLDKTVTVSDSYNVVRSPVNEVYDFIIADLKFAEANLPVRSKAARVGQATKGAAEGILGEVYLTLGDKNSAKEVLMNVIKSQEYELLPSYGSLWDLKHENSKEAVFEINFVAGPTNPSSPYWESFTPFENFVLTGQGLGLNQVTDELWNSYETNDPRRDLSIFAGYNDATGKWIPIKFAKKWYDDTYIRTKTYYYENNFIVQRYAGILLMYAEASGDAEYLNKVRRRVGLPEFGTPDYPTDKYPTLDLAIEHEREVELALEFHRWFDLKRTNRAIDVLSASKGKTITTDMLLLPIPQSVIDQNPKIVQNKNY
ncbi:MAG: RagB/SusD family nutrient uptake outer membrane protein [Bacteroidales bacterium]|nr:RagB/SusD family nutrient uptake outer membrane protein [Bacteroidales bacterium]